jgi:hypothetical protein
MDIIIIMIIVYPILFFISIQFYMLSVMAFRKGFREDSVTWLDKIIYLWYAVGCAVSAILFMISPIIKHGINGFIGIAIGAAGWYLFFRRTVVQIWIFTFLLRGLTVRTSMIFATIRPAILPMSLHPFTSRFKLG